MQYILFKKSSNKKDTSRDKNYLLYYLVMFGVLFFVTQPKANFSALIRYAYYGAVILPLFFNIRFVPFVITAFYGTSLNACYCFMPESFQICIAIVLLLFVLNLRKLNIQYRSLLFLLILYLYSVLLCFLFDDSDQKFISVGFVAFLLFAFIKNEKDVHLLALAFCLVSFALAVMYFINFRYYAVLGGANNGFEIGSWMNVNALAGSIACGLPLSLAFLLNVIKGEQPVILKVFLNVNSVLILFTLIVISSRGALFSALLVSLVLIMISKIHRGYKITLVVLFVVLTLFAFYQGYMDYLISRITEKENTESLGGRTTVWMDKLSDFQEQDVISIMFGLGRNKGSHLGSSYFFSTHNDFLTALIGFGVMGFLLLVSTIIAPVFMTRKSDIGLVLALMLFLAFECSVLEPLYRGYLLFWVYYILIVKLALVNRKQRSPLRKKFSL